MTRNKKILKKIGYGFLSGILVISGIVPLDGGLTARARSVIVEDSTGNNQSYAVSPFGVTLRKLYKWCNYLDRKEYKTAEDVYDHSVYHTAILEKNIKVGQDRNGNVWYGDCVSLTFGGPHNIYDAGGSMPAIVNVHCYSNPTGVSEGILPSGCMVEFNNEKIFAPAIEIGTNAIANTSIAILSVPETYMCIADKAFYQNEMLQKISFMNEDGATENFGANLTHIGNYAFAGCVSLQQAILPKQLLEASIANGKVRDTFNYTNNYGKDGWVPMGTNVYRDCKSLKEVNIECENALIPTQAFAGCENIETINIKAKTAIINHGAFSGAGANKLKNITLDCDAKIGSFAFCDNGNLENVTFNGKVEFKENTASEDNVESSNIFFKTFLKRSSQGTSVTFNGNADVTIPTGCFDTTGYLDKVVFSDQVEKITVRKYAFSNTGIENLEFTGKMVDVETGGLYGLANTTSVTFNNTDSTYLSKGAFKADETVEPVTSVVKKITFNSASVNCYSFDGTANDASIVFGTDVEKVNWGTERLGYSAGTVKNVYVTSPNTDFYSGEIPNEDYTVYGFADTKYKNYIDKTATKVLWGNYIRELKVWSSDDVKDTPEMFKSVGFDASKIKVFAKKADKSDAEEIPYSADGKSDGYTIDDESKKRIENAMSSDGITRTTLNVCYCGITTSKDVVFLPKEATYFDVKIKDGTSFVEGAKISVDDFVVSNVVYNDASTEPEVLHPENISIKLKSGAETLSGGTNTVIISYNGAEKEVNVTVGDKTITSVTAKLKMPTKKYYPGDKLSSDDFIVTAEYNNGDIIEDFKDFKLVNDTISESSSGIAVVTVDVNGISSLVEVPIASLEVKLLLASYTGAEVFEGDSVNKSNVTVTVVYDNNTMCQLSSSEFDLVYQPIVAGKDNEIKVVLLADPTKTKSFFVSGKKRNESDLTGPTDTTQTAAPTTQPTQGPSDTTTQPTQAPGNATEKPTPTNSQTPAPSSTNAPGGNGTVGSSTTSNTQNTNQNVDGNSVPASGVTKLAATSYKLGKDEKVTISFLSGKATKFESSDSSIATVTAEGVVTAQKVGSTTIKVTDGFGVVKDINITVKKAPTSKTFKASVSKKTLKVGKKLMLKPKFSAGYYSNSIKFTSSKKNIATVSSKGVVTAKKKGKVVITLKTFNGKVVKVRITVK